MGKGKKKEKVGGYPYFLNNFSYSAYGGWQTADFLSYYKFLIQTNITLFWEYLNKFLSVFLFGYMNGVVTNLDLLAFKLILPFLRRYGVFLRRHCRKCHNPLYSRHRRLLWAVLSAVTAPTLIPAIKSDGILL